MINLSLIKKPWITEKAATMSHTGKYVFLVDSRAVAPEIKKALQHLYHIDVVQVRIINIPGKTKRSRGLPRVRHGYKKAVVTLKKGQSIETSAH